jgi:hypothetical protein
MLGLVQKFKVERNAEPYPEHEGQYFVLFPKKDAHAKAALMTYADSVEATNPELAKELRKWLAA